MLILEKRQWFALASCKSPICKHTGARCFASYTEDNVFDNILDTVVSTQIDIEPASDISHTSQKETLRLLHDSKSEGCQGDSLFSANTRENKAKEAEAAPSHLNAEAHSQTSQQTLQGTADVAPPIQGYPIGPVLAKECCQHSDHLPTELDPSLTVVSTVGKSTQETQFAISAPQEFDCRLDNSIIEEIIMQDVKDVKDVKEPTNGAKEDCSKCKVGVQIVPRINTAPRDKDTSWPVQNVQPDEYEIHKSKSVINLLEDPITPALDNFLPLQSADFWHICIH